MQAPKKGPREVASLHAIRSLKGHESIAQALAGFSLGLCSQRIRPEVEGAAENGVTRGCEAAGFSLFWSRSSEKFV
jgi:hypothetical protein